MKAAILEGVGKNFIIKDVDRPVLGKGEVLVKIKSAALNHRDNWIKKGKYAGLKFPIILGSDGSGIVEQVFDKENEDWLGKEVVINPGFNWGNNENFQGSDFEILGLPNNGTFAEYVKVKAAYIHGKPKHLTFEQAAAFPLAGLTTYRALFSKAHLKVNEKIFITGIGGGTATFALLWAIKFGAEVYVSSSSDEKINKAIKLGAKAGVNYTNDDWDQQLKEISGGIDVIIDSAIGDGFSKHLNFINPGGRIVFFGATAGEIPNLNPRIIFWKQIEILGTTMGSPKDFQSMLEFINEKQIFPEIDKVFSIENINEAFKKMDNSTQFGKIILQP